MDRIKSDKRFAHVLSDPRFKGTPRTERKVKIDKRFNAMFNDKQFQLKYSVDKRGRPVSYSTTEDLKKYYELSSEEGSSDDLRENLDPPSRKTDKTSKKKKKLAVEVPEKDSLENVIDETPILVKSAKHKKCKKSHKVQNEETEKISSAESSDETSNDDENSNDKLESLNSSEDEDEETVDLARGEGNVETSSDSDDDSDESSDHEDDPWGELDTKVPEATEITNRLALCNMDWDRIKAHDLLLLFNSFKPADGIIKSVKIYQTDFGKQRLQDEEVKGPHELVEEVISESEEETTEGSKFHMEKLRKYQINRLKYYFALVECDSAETANKLYEDCDGVEYESSSARLDLRFIPNDMTFEDAPVSSAESVPDTYRPNLFVTSALQQAKVHLTWDETDPLRIQATQEAFTKENNGSADLKNFLASGSESDSEDDRKLSKSDDDGGDDEETAVPLHSKKQSSIAKYRSLLLSIEEAEKSKKERDVQMEITWEPGLRETAEQLVKKKNEDLEELTPWDQYLKKKKEKKMTKKEEKKKIKGTSCDSADNLYSDDELPSDVDLSDKYFREENIGTPATLPKKQKKNKKLGKRKMEDEIDEDEMQKKAELELLLVDENDGKRHFSLDNMLEKKPDKKKKKMEPKKLNDDFQMDVSDPRFEALYTSHLYNVDPSDPQFKKTKGMDAVIQEKQKRRTMEPYHETKKSNLEPSSVRVNGLNSELSVLVKSIKNKSLNFSKNRKNRNK